MQCLAEFALYIDLHVTPQEAHHVILCPRRKIVLSAMSQSRQNEVQSKAIKQDRWNNREADRQAEKAFLERDLANSQQEHRLTHQWLVLFQQMLPWPQRVQLPHPQVRTLQP